ncbi:MAG: bifunctional DNA-formamidopyrimidine glycosylase/DNA-(apurinic or apyrimidinic site) lyase [Syntrophobacterales bacterium]|jgi:formamidopyrimidine-DNA glycosylase|nr:bifunctional DNA-formamidopyrimidine glycosylase/DNA-(apurinic or apyrimidinic site) lyase [Syntrophobacterales bacterium]
MPELPEVEVIRRGLAPLLEGRRFLGLEVGDKRLRQQSTPEELRRWVVGHRLVKLERRGKYLRFDLEGGATLLIHLGMTGRLLAGPLPTPPLPHIHLVFQVEGGINLYFQDVRRFGQVLVFPPGVKPAPLEQVGAEPFSPEVTAAWLLAQARGKTRPIKNFLLDARVMAGIGNIYACEILFAAGLHPATPAGRLTLKEWDRVLRQTRRILKLAIAKGGTTVSDYLNSKGESGLFQLELKVYGRAGEPCSRCGAPIVRLVQAGRSSFFCPACQPEKD